MTSAVELARRLDAVCRLAPKIGWAAVWDRIFSKHKRSLFSEALLKEVRRLQIDWPPTEKEWQVWHRQRQLSGYTTDTYREEVDFLVRAVRKAAGEEAQIAVCRSEPDIRFADLRHPGYEEATKEHIRDWMQETMWIIAESYGADRDCGACRTVMRRLDRRQYDGTACMLHDFGGLPLPQAPSPWSIAAERLERERGAEYNEEVPGSEDA